jgi:hypothetical protein
MRRQKRRKKNVQSIELKIRKSKGVPGQQISSLQGVNLDQILCFLSGLSRSRVIGIDGTRTEDPMHKRINIEKLFGGKGP